VSDPSLKLFLLGRAYIARQSRQIRVPTRKGIGLIAYLALEGIQSRARLAEVFWGQFDEARGRMNLRRELKRLKDLGLDDLLIATSTSLQTAPELQCDALEFLRAVKRNDAAAAVQHWGGDFLAGLDAEDDLEFDHWFERQRLSFQAQHLDSLHSFAAQLEGRNENRQAIDVYGQILNLDNLNESVYRALIRLHGTLNEREQALGYFRQLEAALEEELGLTPLPETLALVQSLRSRDKKTEPPARKNVADLFDPPFVGRDDMIEEFNRRKSQIQLLLGEAGIGKSRLAVEYLTRSGAYLRLQGREDWRGITLAPITAALRAHLKALEALSSSDRLEVARLIPELEPNLKNLERSNTVFTGVVGGARNLHRRRGVVGGRRSLVRRIFDQRRDPLASSLWHKSSFYGSGSRNRARQSRQNQPQRTRTPGIPG
jgi:DNA-binding SARP family transcriptional activator